MLCDVNSTRGTGEHTEHHFALQLSAKEWPGALPGAQREGMGAKAQPGAFSDLHKGCDRLSRQPGATFPSSQECPCSLLFLPILSQQSQISPDKEKEAMRVTKKYWFQPPERIKVNLLTADNINLPESKCSPSSEELHSQLYNNPRTLALGTSWPSVSRGQLINKNLRWNATFLMFLNPKLEYCLYCKIKPPTWTELPTPDWATWFMHHQKTPLTYKNLLARGKICNIKTCFFGAH